jgi:signal transduction histidine kinase
MPRQPFDVHHARHHLSHGVFPLSWPFKRRRLPSTLQPFAHSRLTPLHLRLHDEVGQWLALGLLHLDNIRATQSDLHETLTPLRMSLEHARQAMQHIVRDEDPDAPTGGSLLAAIEHGLASSPWGNHPLQCILGPELADIPAEAAPLAMRAIRELVGNAHRHAYANNIYLRVWCLDRLLHIWVDDDGIGTADAEDNEHFGLRSLHYQVASEGGSLRVCAKPGIGTRISAEFPLRGRLTAALAHVGHHRS